jgi:hypothetical protein
MFFRRGQDEVIQRIEERIAGFSMIPVGACACRVGTALLRSGLLHRSTDHGEGIQVLHYAEGQKYEVRGLCCSIQASADVSCVRAASAATDAPCAQAHYDYFHDQLNVQNGGQRVATVLLYLCAPAAVGKRLWLCSSDVTSAAQVGRGGGRRGGSHNALLMCRACASSLVPPVLLHRLCFRQLRTARALTRVRPPAVRGCSILG